jgi:hypothetical protein
MTTIARTPVAQRLTPVWMARVPPAALAWATAYGAVRLWFATGHGPVWKLPTDLLIPAWASVAGCVLSGAAVVALQARPRSRVLMGFTWTLAAAWVAVSALVLLDFVAGVLPGLGIPFDSVGLLSRLGGLTGAVLLGGTALARQRQLNPDCLRCTGIAGRVSSTPRWALAGAWVAVGACAARILAQAAVGFGSTPYASSLSMIAFEAGFLLAGTALPLLLVYRAGSVFPRWMLLLPGAGLGAGITAYFGVALVQMIVAALQGEAVYGGTSLPDSFFWVAVPAYLVWGVGLAVATYGYYLRTRKPCKGCGR